jgi:hypothetical protein
MVKMSEYLEMKPEDKADHMVCCVCQKKYDNFIVEQRIKGLYFYCYDHWKELDEQNEEDG